MAANPNNRTAPVSQETGAVPRLSQTQPHPAKPNPTDAAPGRHDRPGQNR
ncbi:hypothetical protein H9Q13_15885 [Pontibacter sp. JH31]|uniref:Uncharacterized protein n=1 Tax=Pontibacter aquaedesilientis TaxID=2766980 RepID=A0ABR7XK26_9BACT|nr:hypothetical protein [Pontibacter aquaedesilientis]